MDLQLTEIKIQNLLSYKNAKFTKLKDYNVLIGKNNVGKSNLFKILRTMQKSFQCSTISQKILFDDNPGFKGKILLTFKLSDTLIKRLLLKLQSINNFLNYIKKIRAFSKFDESELINYLIENDYYNSVKIKLLFLNDYPDIFLLQGVYLIHKEKISQSLFEMKKENGKLLIYVLSQSIDRIEKLLSLDDFVRFGKLKRIDQEYPKNDLGNFFRGAHYRSPYLSFFLPAISDLFRNHLFLIPDNRSFPECLKTAGADTETLKEDGSTLIRYFFKQENDPEGKVWMDQLNLELKEYFPNLRSISQKFKTDKTEIYYQENNLSIDIEKENKGAAILHITFFLAYLKNIPSDSILLIEEPELYLFPGLQKQLRNKILEKSKNIQTIITTHSRQFLPESSENSSVYSIKKKINQTKVYYVPEEKYIDIYEDLDINIEEYEQQKGLLYNESFWDKFINRAIIKTEDQLWDFKQTLEMWEVEKSKRDKFKIKFSERVSAFANEAGGLILIGISDKIPRKIVGVEDTENKINDISKTLMKWSLSKIKYFEIRDLVLKDEKGSLKNIILLAIKQTQNAIGIKHPDGRYSYPLRSGAGTINSSYAAILKTKSDIYSDNFNFFYLIQEFCKE